MLLSQIITAIFTAVIAVATVTYVIYTKKLWRETKRAADAAKDAVELSRQSFVALNRPYIGISKIDRKPPRHFQDGLLQIDVQLMNFGTVPAGRVNARLGYSVDGGPMDFGEPEPAFELFPGATSTITRAMDVDADLHASILNGIAKFEFETRARYSVPGNGDCEYVAKFKYAHATNEFHLEGTTTENC